MVVSQLEELTDKVKKLTKQRLSGPGELKSVTDAVCSLAWNVTNDNKQLKQCVKLLADIEKISRGNVVATALAKYVNLDQKDQNSLLRFVQFWSQLVDVTKSGRTLFCTDLERHVSMVTKSISDAVEHLSNRDTTTWQPDDDETLLHCCIKLQLLMSQHWKSELLDLTNQKVVYKTVQDALLSVLSSGSVPKDCVLLAGTCLAFQLNSEGSPPITVQRFLKLYELFSTETTNHSNLPDNLKCRTRNERSDLLARIALLNGVLSCVNRECLCQVVLETPDETPDYQTKVLARSFGLVLLALLVTVVSWFSHRFLPSRTPVLRRLPRWKVSLRNGPSPQETNEAPKTSNDATNAPSAKPGEKRRNTAQKVGTAL